MRVLKRSLILFFVVSFIMATGMPAVSAATRSRYAIVEHEESQLTAGMWGSVKNWTRGAVAAGEEALAVGGRIISRAAGAAGVVFEVFCPQFGGVMYQPHISIESAGDGKVNVSWRVEETDDDLECKASGDWSGGKSVNGGTETKTVVCGQTYTYSISCSMSKGWGESINDKLCMMSGERDLPTMSDSKSVTPQCAAGESTPTNITIYSGGSSGGGKKPSYCSTIDRGSGACAKACYTSVKKCDECKYKNGCGGKAPEEKKNIEVELKGPDPSQKRSDGLRRVKADKEVEYKAEVDHADDDEKIEYRFKCNEDKTGRQQKVNSKKDSQKFRCTYHINKGTEKYQDPVIRVEQKDRGKAKDTKTILVYLDPLTPDPEVVNGGGDTDPPLPSAAPETDIRGE